MAAIIAGWAAEVTITKLVETAYSFFIEQSDRLDWIQQRTAADGLGRLRTRYEQVHEVLAVIKNRSVTMDEMDPGLRSWLWQFRDAVDDADNLLDDFEHRRLQDQMCAEEGVKVPSIYQPTSKFIKIMRSAFGNDPLVEKLAQVVKQLDGVVANTGDFLSLVYNMERRLVRDERRLEMDRSRETGSLPTESRIFGREKETEEIRNWLLDADFDFSSNLGAPSNSISALTIVGIGGVGKTTLVQEIYNDTKVKGSFSETMWVCVSSTFDVPKILYKMVEDEGNAAFRENLNLLQEAVRKKITSKKFLLVLDDVWDDEHHEEWKALVASLQYGKSGSKILVTTRIGSVAKMVQNVMGESMHRHYNLKSLEYDDFIPLLNRYAFAGVNIHDYRDLQLVSQEIAKKLGGIPLLGKVVGGQLNSYLDYDYWVRVLDSDVMDLQEGEKKVFEVLKLSYQNLPTKLHACFRYCSIFPEDYDFEKDELIQMWLAAGLIPESYFGKSRPEDIGEEFFNALVSKSFLNETQWDTYAMHDSLHNLACSLSKDECWSVKGNDSKNFPRTIRHLSVRVDDISILKSMSQPRHLRTLVLEYNESARNLASVLNNLLEGLSCLRVLKLHGPSIDEFPMAIAGLLRLRYISFYTNCDLLVPNCFNKLYHLQAIHLCLFACRRAIDLMARSLELAKADAFSKLTRLRYFSLIGDHIDCSVALFPGFGKLTSLQELDKFDVKDEDGYKLGELKELDDLHYSLEIYGIQNVRNYTEATEAFLKNKRFLNSLSFTWNSDNSDLEENTEPSSFELEETAEPGESDLEEKAGSDEMSFEENVDLGEFYLEEKTSSGDLDLQDETQHDKLDSEEETRQDDQILNCLKPHSELKKLSINGYPGVTLPGWLVNESLSNLSSLTLRGCHRIIKLPPVGKLPFLKSLHLIDLPGIRQIGHEFYGEGQADFFPVLEELKMSSMPECKEWHAVKEANELFPRLRSLCISSCPLLKQIPSLPLSINEIDFNDVGLSSLPCLTTNWQEESSSSVLSCSLSSLIIWHCENLTTLAEGLLQAQRNMVSLSKIEIRWCKNIVSLPIGGFTGLVSLKDLFIEFPPTLATFLSEELFPTSIERLSIVDQVDVFLPKIFGLTNLSFLELERSEMAVLPMEEEFRKLTSLSYLAIYQFGKIKSLGGLYALSFLDTLRIDGCHMLEMLDFEMGGKGLSKLASLEIEDCKEMLFLRNLHVLSSLKYLKVQKCPKLSSLTFKQKSPISENERPNTQQLMALDCFDIKYCSELESLGVLHSMASVDSASIFGCQKLAKKALEPSSTDISISDSIPKNGSLSVNILTVDDPSYLLLAPLRSLTSIKELIIQDCSSLIPRLENFLLQNRGSIRELHLIELGDLESLPQVLEELCNLTNLDVQDAMKLQSLPQMPASLKILRIECCNPELQKKCERRIGELWPKIAHVPSINIIP